MKRTTKLRIIGSVILLFNLTLCGHYGIEGIALLLMTFGFAIGFEYLVVKPSIKAEATKQKSIRSKFSQITTSELQSASNLTEKSGKNHEAEELLTISSGQIHQLHISRIISALGKIDLLDSDKKRVNAYLRFLSRIGHKFKLRSLSGTEFSGELFFSDIESIHQHTIAVKIQPV